MVTSVFENSWERSFQVGARFLQWRHLERKFNLQTNQNTYHGAKNFTNTGDFSNTRALNSLVFKTVGPLAATKLGPIIAKLKKDKKRWQNWKLNIFLLKSPRGQTTPINLGHTQLWGHALVATPVYWLRPFNGRALKWGSLLLSVSHLWSLIIFMLVEEKRRIGAVRVLQRAQLVPVYR